MQPKTPPGLPLSGEESISPPYKGEIEGVLFSFYISTPILPSPLQGGRIGHGAPCPYRNTSIAFASAFTTPRSVISPVTSRAGVTSKP